MILDVFILTLFLALQGAFCYLQCTCIVILQSLVKNDTDRLT